MQMFEQGMKPCGCDNGQSAPKCLSCRQLEALNKACEYFKTPPDPDKVEERIDNSVLRSLAIQLEEAHYGERLHILAAWLNKNQSFFILKNQFAPDKVERLIEWMLKRSSKRCHCHNFRKRHHGSLPCPYCELQALIADLRGPQ